MSLPDVKGVCVAFCDSPPVIHEPKPERELKGEKVKQSKQSKENNKSKKEQEKQRKIEEKRRAKFTKEVQKSIKQLEKLAQQFLKKNNDPKMFLQNEKKIIKIRDNIIRKSIFGGLSVTFQVSDNADAHPYDDPLYALDIFEEVSNNSTYIRKAAANHHVDPDLIRAIIWMESTHGKYDIINPLKKTIRPMNVHTELWKELGITKKDLKDAETNILCGTYILSEIWKRIENPTVEKVATLYNNLGYYQVSGYGKTVAVYYRKKPWKN